MQLPHHIATYTKRPIAAGNTRAYINSNINSSEQQNGFAFVGTQDTHKEPTPAAWQHSIVTTLHNVVHATIHVHMIQPPSKRLSPAWFFAHTLVLAAVAQSTSEPAEIT